jgi:dihydroorotate dehydrogenase (NAD+) catalytic subunit
VTQARRSLAVDVGGLRLPTPVLIASGCAGTGKELHGLVDLRRLGGVVSRTVTPIRSAGVPPPRITESPSGIVWDTGLQNPGIEAFIEAELVTLARTGVPVVVSIGGGSLEDYVRLTGALQGRPEVAALEVYLAGVDVEWDRPVLGEHPDRVTEIVGAVARMSLVPVFAKLPGGIDPVPLAEAAMRAGASGLTLSGGPAALASTDDGGAMVRGWLAGPALRPLTLRAVSDVSAVLPDVPIIASGGIRSAADAVAMLRAGASAVQLGTATLLDPAAPVHIAQGLIHELRGLGLTSPGQLRGPAATPLGASGGTRS